MIDIFTHILPRRYKEALDKKAKHTAYQEMNKLAPAVCSLDARFRVMDRYEGLKHVLTIAAPPLESVVNSADAIELAKLANDEMAELVLKYPERFVAAIAYLPMNNIDQKRTVPFFSGGSLIYQSKCLNFCMLNFANF